MISSSVSQFFSVVCTLIEISLLIGQASIEQSVSFFAIGGSGGWGEGRARAGAQSCRACCVAWLETSRGPPQAPSGFLGLCSPGKLSQTSGRWKNSCGSVEGRRPFSGCGGAQKALTDCGAASLCFAPWETPFCSRLFHGAKTFGDYISN